jgi:hypothetical protein
LSPYSVERRLGELRDSSGERIRLEAAKTVLDRHLGRPAIQATSASIALRLMVTSLRCSRSRAAARWSRSYWRPAP